MTYIVLVLVSFGLVLLATILLVVGLLTDDGLTLIYFSIAASFTAAVVLYLAFRKARPKADTDLQPPTPIAPEGVEDEAPAPRSEPTVVAPAVTTPEAVVAASEEPEPEPGDLPEPVPAGAGEPADDWTADDDWADDGEFDVEFPIADYDDLTVAEIMPLLPQLYSDELGVVAERERNGKNRSTILARLDELAATGTAADALEAETLGTEADAGPMPAAADDEPMPAVAEAAAAAVGSRDETLSTPRPAAPAPQVPSLADDEYDDGYVFPIADYDELSVDQIVPLLSQLEDDELEEVKEREAAGQGRKTVIAEIDRQLGLVEAADSDLDDDGWADERATPAPRPAPQAEAAEGAALAIAGYDGLTVAQIRPLLSGLGERELRAVLAHEVARDNRVTIVSDIERRLDGAAEPEAVTPAAPRRAAKKASARKASTTKKAAASRATKATSKRSATKKSARSAKKAATPRFPIADYDNLTVAQIRPRLSDLSDAQLRQVRDREQSGAGRKTILNEIASRLG